MVNAVISFVVVDNSHWLVFLMRVMRVVMTVVVVIVVILFLAIMVVNMVYNDWFMVFMSVSRVVGDWYVVIIKGNMWVLSIIVDLSTLDGRFGWQVAMWSNNNMLLRVSIVECIVIGTKVEVTSTSCRDNNKSSSESCEGFH